MQKDTYGILQSYFEEMDDGIRPSAQAIVQLITSGIQHWSKKDTSLLAVQCGSGIFLNTLCNNAFTIACLETDAATQARLIQRGMEYVIKATSTRYINTDTNSYEYAVVLYPLFCGIPLNTFLPEVMRVTARSILLLAMNKCSFERIIGGVARGIYKYCCWSNIYSIARAIKDIQTDVTIHIESTAFMPCIRSSKRNISSYPIYPIPIGTMASIRIDIPPFFSYTPLLRPTRMYTKQALGVGASCTMR